MNLRRTAAFVALIVLASIGIGCNRNPDGIVIKSTEETYDSDEDTETIRWDDGIAVRNTEKTCDSDEDAEAIYWNEDIGIIEIDLRKFSHNSYLIRVDNENGYLNYFVQDKKFAIIPLLGDGTYRIRVYSDEYGEQIFLDSMVAIEIDETEFVWDRSVRLSNLAYINYSDCEDYLTELYNYCKKDKVLDTLDSLNSYFHKFEYDYEVYREITSTENPRHYIDIPEVLESRKGICRDMAACMVATLRNAGYVTRMVEGQIEGHETYHAWVEVKVGTDWLMYDPTKGINYKDSEASKYNPMYYY